MTQRFPLRTIQLFDERLFECLPYRSCSATGAQPPTLRVAYQSAGGGGGPQNVTWTNASGVAVNGNSLTKTAAAGWGNAGTSSTQTIASGDGYVEFTASETTTYRMLGLSNGDSNQDYSDIDFAIYPAESAGLHVYEGGVYRGTFGSYTTGDALRVAVEGGVVKYKKNGVVFYTSTVAPAYPLLVDTSLYSNGSTINNVVMSSGGGSGPSTTVRWLVPDHLGTPRMIFDQSGSLANVSRHDYLPFGEELFAGTGGRTTSLGYTAGDGVRQKFTGYERDNETGLDYANARYYAHAQGRFTGVDPVSGVASAPQSWNRYTYSLNNPVNFTDPTGMFANAEYGSDPNRESDPFLDYSKKWARLSNEIQQALAAYDQMVKTGLANLQQKKKEKEEQKKPAPELTAKVEASPVEFDMNLPLNQSNPESGPFFTGFDSVLTITLFEDGKPVAGATGVESVTGSKGETIIQNERPVTTNADGQTFDLVSRGAFTPRKVGIATAREVYETNARTVVDVTSQQTLTLKLPSGGSAQVTFERRLTNLDAKGNLRPAGPARTGGPTNFTITVGPVAVKRLP